MSRHAFAFRPVWLLVCFLSVSPLALGQPSDAWKAGYKGREINGPHVLGFWKFEPGQEAVDSAGKSKDGTIVGAKPVSHGKFGGGLESFANTPGMDSKHSLTVSNQPHLSPRAAFTVEFWLKPKPEFAEHKRNSILIDKKYVSDADYQIALESPSRDGSRLIRASLGFGTDSASWYSEPITFEADQWRHLAVTYDGRGQLRFFLDGKPVGGDTKSNRGGIAAGNRPLSIGDRLGSTYAGFPGFLDEVRLTDRVIEFRPMPVQDSNLRKVFLRGEPNPTLLYDVTNRLSRPLEGVTARVEVVGVDENTGVSPMTVKLPTLTPGQVHQLELPFNTMLRPDRYEVRVSVEIPGEEKSSELFPVQIVGRPVPDRLPVVMWGVGGVDNVTRETDRLKRIGFTHCLGLNVDYSGIMAAGKPAPAVKEDDLPAVAEMLDHALANDIRVITHLAPGRWLSGQAKYQRLDPNGKPYPRENLANAFPELDDYFFNVGASAAKTYGQFPAFEAGLINTEIRDGTQVSFRPEELAAFKKFSGFVMPKEVKSSRGVPYTRLPDFPKDRVVEDDHPIRTFYRWFWTKGDGWNGWHTAVHNGFRSTDRKDLWTFFDPAVRCPTIAGSGGEVDYLSHWTYSYPDPIRIGLCADELFAMAARSPRNQAADRAPQKVMKMTQVIWYRSQTAPMGQATDQSARSPWEDFDPDAAYITIAPAHMREAFWTKISRPVQGIMYHGWQSLVPGGHSSYRYTHPDTQDELSRLVSEVVEPLGPLVKTVPAATKDVGFLESFTAQMFASRGTYGWGHSWAGDFWHALQYAHLQPEIVHEDGLGDLSRFKVLVLPDCDVLPRSVVEQILAYQKAGGIVVADSRLTPAIKPDVVVPFVTRQKKADQDKTALLQVAADFRKQLDARYVRTVDTSNPEVIPYSRRAGNSDYVFLVNDHREFGDYVGQHGLVMENGLPSTADVRLNRPAGSVYDLVRSRPVAVRSIKGGIVWPTELGPADGTIYLVTPKPIAGLSVDSPKQAKRGDAVQLKVQLFDPEQQPVPAIVPVRLQVTDPAGRTAELSGSYATKEDGSLQLPWELAPNETPGLWRVRAIEGASNTESSAYVRVMP